MHKKELLNRLTKEPTRNILFGVSLTMFFISAWYMAIVWIPVFAYLCAFFTWAKPKEVKS